MDDDPRTPPDAPLPAPPAPPAPDALAGPGRHAAPAPDAPPAPPGTAAHAAPPPSPVSPPPTPPSSVTSPPTPAPAVAPEPGPSAVAVLDRPGQTAAGGREPEADGAVPDGPSGPGAPTRADWWRALRFSALVYLGVRLGLFVVGLLSTALIPRNPPVDVPGWPATDPSASWHHVFTAWERHDALWYLRLASRGYAQDDASAAFFPLYPLLSRGVANVLGDRWLLGAYLVSNLALVVGLTVLYRLTALEFGDTRARRTVLYLAVFPTALFLYAPYTESLFLALSVGCLYAARRSSWLLAGYLGAMASLTRSTGLLLVLPLAVEALLQHRTDPGLRRLAGRLVAAASVLLGTGSYFLYWERFAGDWRRPLDVQGSTWSRERSWPWETLQAGFTEGTRYFGTYAGGYHSVDALVVLVALVAGVWIAVRVRLTYAVWYWATLLFPMTLAFGGRPFLSLPRFIVVMFPLFWALSALAARWRAHDLVVAASACGLGLLSLLYVSWYFIF